MKKRLLTILLLVLLIIGLDWLAEALRFYDKPSRIRQVSAFLIYTFLFFLVVVNLTYRVFYDLRSKMPKVLFFLVMSIVVAMYLSDRTQAVTRLWGYAVNLQRRADPFLFQDDPRLGYRPVPGTQGFYEYYIGDSIHGKVPVRFDSRGFRTADVSSRPTSDTQDLYLGCSFTFGDYIPAEESYPFKASRRMGHTAVNAGLSGYGLAQMIQLADSLIPTGKFRYVFIQMSYWLVDRAVQVNRTTLYGYKGVPYFSMGSHGPALQYPPYRTRFQKKAREWHQEPRTYGRKLLFAITDGFTIEFVDYSRYMLARMAMRLGLSPRPAADRRSVETAFYDHVIELSRKYGAIPVIVKMSYPDDGAASLLSHIRGKAVIADADKAVADSCRRTGKSYAELFHLHHPHPNGPIPFDNHPNPAMTNLVADVILEAVSKQSQ